MAYQLSSIITLVQQRIKDTQYSASEITQYINDTQNDVFNEYRLGFMEASQDYTTVANVADITNGVGLPANYLVAIDLLNTSDGLQVLIPYKDVNYLDQLVTSPTDTYQLGSNTPGFWYKYGGTIHIYPTPTTSFDVTLRYYKMPTQLSADADVPDIPYAFQELLVVGAAYRVMQVKDNYDIAGILQNKYDEILQKLVNMTAVNQVGKSPQVRINRYATSKRHF